jgi:hypothetical protein
MRQQGLGNKHSPYRFLFGMWIQYMYNILNLNVLKQTMIT